MRIVPYPGGKDTLVTTQAKYLPKDGFDKAWETCAGTAAMTVNLFAGMNLEEIVLTEIEVGMASLLQQVQENPVEFIKAVMQTEYTPAEYDWADEQEENNFAGLSKLEIACARYIKAHMSHNGMGKEYRDIDKGADDDIECWKNGQRCRDKYKRQMLPCIMGYAEALNGVKIIHGDMFDYYNNMIGDSGRLIYADVPYVNELRADKLYKVESDKKWHMRLVKQLANDTKSGKLKAQVMLCGYANLDDLSKDLYCQELLAVGWKLYLIKEVLPPTIFQKSSKSRKKTKRVECVWLNYEPIDPEINQNRIFDYEKVFGKGGGING